MGTFIEKNFLLELCAQLMDGHISYGYGSKAKLDAEPSQIKKIDCSGFTRYLLYKATGGTVKMVDGSDEQHSWCKKNKLTKEKYMEAAGRMDRQLRIAFIPRVYEDGAVKKAGHVWFILDGMTIESHGGKGPNRRPWNTSKLVRRVNGCYVLANMYTLGIPHISIGF